MKKLILFFVSLVAFSPLFGQTAHPSQTAQNPNSQEVIVRVQTEQQKPAGADKPAVEKANEWVEFGKNVGLAMDAGLASLTDHADKFSKTDAGRFTMIVIAWKVMGKDAMNLMDAFTSALFGIPMLIVWTAIFLWYIRRMFICHRVCVKKEGWLWWAKREYEIVNHDLNWSGDKCGGLAVSVVIYLIVSAVLLIIIF